MSAENITWRYIHMGYEERWQAPLDDVWYLWVRRAAPVKNRETPPMKGGLANRVGGSILLVVAPAEEDVALVQYRVIGELQRLADCLPSLVRGTV